MNTQDILRENARTVQETIEHSRLLRDGVISEAARAFLRDPALTDPILTYKSIMGDILCTPEFAKFCVCVCENDKKMSIIDYLPESVSIGEGPQSARVAYQQNNHSDRAFSLFCKSMVHKAQAVHRPTTISVCEEVHYGHCTHCILPIYSSKDGIFTTFAKLVDKYDLVINAACDVTMPDGDSVMRFALLRHELSLPVSDWCYVQLNAVFPQSASLTKLLFACESIGASVAEMLTLPLAYTMDNVSYTIRFFLPRRILTALLMFLHSVLDNYSLEGIFSIIQ